MALPISDKLKALLANGTKKPQLILEIEGLPSFSSIQAQKYAVYGDPIEYGDPGLVYGGLVADDSIYPYIMLDKSTQNITQQMLVDKGGFSSITSFDVALVDKNGFVTELISPGNTVTDIISKKARLYLSLEGAGHPQDSVLFFSGIVAGVSSYPGYVKINLASPEKLKNLELFPKVSTELNGAINNSQTTITVNDTTDFILPADSGTLRTYIKIDDEIIEYTGTTPTTFTGCVRGAYDTIPSAHDDDANVESAYRLTGNLRDLSLKLMLSGLNTPYVVNEPIIAFETYGDYEIENAIFVSRFKIDEYYGIVSGDTIEIFDSNVTNNGVTTINDIVTTELGSYIVVNKTLIADVAGTASFSITSKYATLPKYCGLEMTPDQVDVFEFERKYTQFSASFFNYDFFIKESVNGSEFINTQILYPSGAYSLPRKAKTSIGLTIPPLAENNTKLFDETNIVNPDRLNINRNISNNFYNAVVIKYDKDAVTDKFKRGKIRQSADSTARIAVANKPLVLEAEGIKAEANFIQKFTIQGRRFLERYQYAAESIDIDVTFGEGFGAEIGDTCILKADQLQVTDIKSSSRNFIPRLFEIQNKSMNLKGTPIRLSLVDTAFSLDGRYGVIAPSSKIDSGSTSTVLRLKRSYGTLLRTVSEGEKWENLIGTTLRIRSKDYSFDHERILSAIDPANDDGIILSSPLPSAPLEGYIVDIAKYGLGTDPAYNSLAKIQYCFWNNQAEVLTGISQTQFTVDALYLPDLKVGYLVKIHSDDYLSQSVQAKITNITGTTITVDTALGFTPIPSFKIELLGFNDGGTPYLIL